MRKTEDGRRLIYVGGGKGGVGKSLVSMCVIDYLRGRKLPILLIDADDTNSDVALAYENVIDEEAGSRSATKPSGFQLRQVDLTRGRDAFYELGDVMRSLPSHNVVINSPAGMRGVITQHGYLMQQLAEENGGRFSTLWPINRQRDSLNILVDYRAAMPVGTLGIIRNLFFGDPERFTRFANSKYAQGLIDSGVAKLGDLPDLDDRSIDLIYDERIAIEDVPDKLDSMRRSGFGRWRDAARSMIERLL